MTTYTYTKSQALFQRAAKVIPCGIYGHFSPVCLCPPTDYPFYISRAKGARFWDIDGNEFIDYMCAYGPMILGYQNEIIDNAAKNQSELSDCVTGPAPVMVELAEYLVDLIPIADWAYFAKNGGDVTSLSLMVARDATHKKKIVLIKGGYHGVAPWAQTSLHHGTIEEDHEHIIRIPWNDIQAFEVAIERYPNDIAAFMATPYHHPVYADNEMPNENYWQTIEALCQKHNIMLIVDDVRCGFRLDIKGSHEYFKFQPDMICFSKAIGNGYPISALVGTESLKKSVANVFYTGTYWFSAVAMAASLAVLQEMKKMDATSMMIEKGRQLTRGLVDIAKTYGFDLKVSGSLSMPYIRITNDDTQMLHQAWCAECTKRGAYFTPHHNWFISTAHTDMDIQQTLDIANEAFQAVNANY